MEEKTPLDGSDNKDIGSTEDKNFRTDENIVSKNNNEVISINSNSNNSTSSEQQSALNENYPNYSREQLSIDSNPDIKISIHDGSIDENFPGSLASTERINLNYSNVNIQNELSSNYNIEASKDTNTTGVFVMSDTKDGKANNINTDNQAQKLSPVLERSNSVNIEQNTTNTDNDNVIYTKQDPDPIIINKEHKRQEQVADQKLHTHEVDEAPLENMDKSQQEAISNYEQVYNTNQNQHFFEMQEDSSYQEIDEYKSFATAYNEYENAYNGYEANKRMSLLTIATCSFALILAAGAAYYIYNGLEGESSTINTGIPQLATIAPDDTPTKLEPEDANYADSSISIASSSTRKKLIYERIVGNESTTDIDTKIVSRENEPLELPTQVADNNTNNITSSDEQVSSIINNNLNNTTNNNTNAETNEENISILNNANPNETSNSNITDDSSKSVSKTQSSIEKIITDNSPRKEKTAEEMIAEILGTNKDSEISIDQTDNSSHTQTSVQDNNNDVENEAIQNTVANKVSSSQNISDINNKVQNNIIKTEDRISQEITTAARAVEDNLKNTNQQTEQQVTDNNSKQTIINNQDSVEKNDSTALTSQEVSETKVAAIYNTIPRTKPIVPSINRNLTIIPIPKEAPTRFRTVEADNISSSYKELQPQNPSNIQRKSGRIRTNFNGGSQPSDFGRSNSEVNASNNFASTTFNNSQKSPTLSNNNNFASAGSYVIQLGAYREASDALARFRQLRQKHPNLLSHKNSFIQRADLESKGIFYRLQVGIFTSSNDSRKACGILASSGERDCLVKKYK